MKTYYETYEYINSGDPLTPDGIDIKGRCIVTAHYTMEDAIKYADENGADLICEIGGSWDEFRKCWFCEEWVPTSELNKNDLCDHCENYLISRGEI